MFDIFLYEISTPRDKRLRDRIEIADLFSKYGDDLSTVIRRRQTDKRLTGRNQRHWRRLAKAIKYFGPNGARLEPITVQ